MTNTPNAPAHVLPSAQATTPAGSPVGGFCCPISKLRAEVDAAEAKWRLTNGTSGGRANYRAYVRAKACLVAAEVAG